MENFNQGLLISLYGIGITFLVLAVVILLIKLILFLFPDRIQAAIPEQQDNASDPNIPHVVAFAAAWWHSQRKDQSLGQNLEKPPGKWWHQTHKSE
jgi:Na+-transporting methylmalonyl-CoA/oxaloacetate decarboxylase gamma subunit